MRQFHETSASRTLYSSVLCGTGVGLLLAIASSLEDVYSSTPNHSFGLIRSGSITKCCPSNIRALKRIGGVGSLLTCPLSKVVGPSKFEAAWIDSNFLSEGILPRSGPSKSSARRGSLPLY